jgi:HEAT repeat protein
VTGRLLGLLRDEAYWREVHDSVSDQPPTVPARDYVCVGVLKLAGAPAMLRGLLDLLTDERKWLRRNAACELSLIAARYAHGGALTAFGHGKLTEADRATLLAPLRAALRDEFWLVRDDAAAALGFLGDRDAVPALIELLAGDEKQQVRYEAARSLGRLGDRRAVAPLRHAPANDPEIGVAVREALSYL